MTWERWGDQYRTRCGHLYVRIESLEGHETTLAGETLERPGDESSFVWFIEPDDEDKSYRRALVTGHASTLEAAQEAARSACDQLAQAMLASLRASS